jgi:endonuclease/exonuclease/phosphatase family metal-dependent hydrolase
MGDFNQDVAQVAAGPLGFLTDVCAEKGNAGKTFPASPVQDPSHRIDGILVSGEWLVRDVAVLVSEDTKAASDHYPVVADLVLVDPRG